MTMTTIDIPNVLALHSKWLRGENDGQRANLREAYLSGAYLREANLREANLSGANLSKTNLREANLSGAYLSKANLSGANLSGANLREAYLSGANLREAYLSKANLSGANLREANLSGAILPTGETWETYLTETVPQLLMAGERGIEAISAWDKHDWTDCPMHVAFSVNDISRVPVLLRPRVEQFLAFFDHGLIPQPTVSDHTIHIELPNGGSNV